MRVGAVYLVAFFSGLLGLVGFLQVSLERGSRRSVEDNSASGDEVRGCVGRYLEEFKPRISQYAVVWPVIDIASNRNADLTTTIEGDWRRETYSADEEYGNSIVNLFEKRRLTTTIYTKL